MADAHTRDTQDPGFNWPRLCFPPLTRRIWKDDWLNWCSFSQPRPLLLHKCWICATLHNSENRWTQRNRVNLAGATALHWLRLHGKELRISLFNLLSVQLGSKMDKVFSDYIFNSDCDDFLLSFPNDVSCPDSPLTLSGRECVQLQDTETRLCWSQHVFPVWECLE